MDLFLKSIKKPKNAILVPKTCPKQNMQISAIFVAKGLAKNVCTKHVNSVSSEAKSAKPATTNS